MCVCVAPSKGMCSHFKQFSELREMEETPESARDTQRLIGMNWDETFKVTGRHDLPSSYFI